MAVSPRGWTLLVWIVVFSLITLTTLGLRFWAIAVQRRKLRVDDYLILVSTASLLAMEGTTFWSIHNGLGAHTNTVTLDEASISLKVGKFNPHYDYC
jgi:hypothetical protein